MPRKNLAWVIVCIAVTVFVWTAARGGLIPPRGPMQFLKGFYSADKDYDNLALMIDVMQYVDMNYVKTLKPEERRKFIEAAIQAGLRSLDPNSSFMNPHEYSLFKKQGEGIFDGVGVQIVVNRETKRVTVISPILGSPAFRAGIKPGDEIETINGEKISELNDDDVVGRIAGAPGTTVTLTIRRRGTGRRMELTLTREEIHTEAILGDVRDTQQKWDFLADKENRLGYVRITSFGNNALDELTQAFKTLENEKVQGLVVDLRNNPGGSLDVSVKMADMLLNEGEIVRVEGRTHDTRIHVAQQEGTFFAGERKIPIVVLINENSASASEILASALQDHKRATIIGERSFGKGSVQRLYPIESGASRLRLTTSTYIRPSGKNIHKFPDSKENDDWGVIPDIEAKLSPAEELDWLLARRDRDILRDEEINRLEMAEKTAVLMGPMSIYPGISGTMHLFTGLAELNLTLPNLIRTSKPYQDKILDKAFEYLRNQIKKGKTT
ncbi:MAG TPA: S41 family peptidase [Gemmatales bacterium]|nr:S41 family peptidase [Gemmatales bacterium]